MFLGGAVFGHDADGSCRDEVESLWYELGRHGLIPLSAVKEGDRAAMVVFRMAFRVETVEDEFALIAAFIDDGFSVFEQFFIANDGDRWDGGAGVVH